MIPAFVLHQPHSATPHATELMVTERQLKKGLIEIDPKALEYVKRQNDRVKNEDTHKMYLNYKLDQLQSKWEEATAFSSSITEIVENEYFKEIINYGENIVPAVLESLRQRPSHLVWALNFITNRTISNKPISVTEASKAWINWGRRNRLIE
jgi:hypothetical protein